MGESGPETSNDVSSFSQEIKVSGKEKLTLILPAQSLLHAHDRICDQGCLRRHCERKVYEVSD